MNLLVQSEVALSLFGPNIGFGPTLSFPYFDHIELTPSTRSVYTISKFGKYGTPTAVLMYKYM